METELVKPVIKVGNSAGVLVPKNWINGKAKVKLIAEPIDIRNDILKILGKYLEDVLGIYIVGSYARGEQTERSDVDVLAITNRKSGRIKSGKYDILLLTENDVNLALKNNALPILPMLKEAKPIINRNLLGKYIKAPLTGKNLKWHIETTKSAIKINKSLIELSESDKNISDNIAYSLILRLRGLYITGCLLKDKIPTRKGLVALIEKVAGSRKAYGGYLRSKNDEKAREELPLEEAKKLLNYIKKEVKRQEQWIKRKGRKK